MNDEFYELRKKVPKKKKNDVDYWKARCKASESQQLKLQQALALSNMKIETLTAVISMLDKFLKKMGVKFKKDQTLLDVLKKTSLVAVFEKGKLPDVWAYEDADMLKDPKGIKDIEGLELELSFGNGLRIGPYFK